MPLEQIKLSQVKWNEVTWYSKLVAIVLFAGVVPALSFYIGLQYERTIVASGPMVHTILSAAPEHPKENLFSIEWGSSFGECSGYCVSKLTVTQSTTTLDLISHSDKNKYPSIHKVNTTDKIMWEKIISQVNLKNIQKLPDSIGCPDCGDGGAEYVIVTKQGQSKRVEYEYGSAPQELKQLADELRQLEIFYRNKSIGGV